MAQLLLAAAVLTILVSGCGGADARRASHIARGQKYLAADQLEKARVEFADALQISPNDAEARFLSGRVAERLGNLGAAASMYQGAIDVNPEHVRARAGLARMYVFAGAPERGLELVKPALLKHPDDANLLTVRGAARAQLKDSAGALADAQRAVELAPTSEDAVALLAGLYQQAGEQQRAIELVRRTLQKLPDSLDLLEVLAKLYIASGDHPRAEEQLVRMVQIKPMELALRFQLASYYIADKRLDDAEHTLRAAVSVAPESTKAKLTYAEFLADQRSQKRGEQALREFITHEPRNFELQLALAGLQQRAGATPDAVATYRAIIAKDPEGPNGVTARDRVAAIDAAAGRYDEALPLIADALKSNPRDNDALTLRGNIALEQGDAESTIADLRAVLRDQPGAVPVMRSLARAHVMNDEPALAEENLRAALRAAPHNVVLSIDLAQLLSQTHRADEAVSLLEDAVRAAPKEPTLREALVRAYLVKRDLAAARSAAEDLKTLRPDLAIGFFLAGLIAQEQRRLDDAQREFEHALKLQPAAVDALTALARLQVARGQREAALTRVRALIERDPSSALARNLLAELYLGGKNYPEAMASLREATRLAPKWWVPYHNQATAQLVLGDRAGGIAAYESGIRATGEPSLIAELAALYEREGRIDDAIRQYETLHEHKPHLALAANNLAMLLVTYRKDQASLDRARDLTAAFATSKVGALLDTRGWVLFKRGDVPQALSTLERASAQAPDSRVIRYHLGMTQLKAGQTDRARASLEAALAGGASFTGTDEARIALAQLKGRAG